MFKSKLALAVALGLGMSSPLWAADGGIEARLAALEARVQAAEARATAAEARIEILINLPSSTPFGLDLGPD